MELTLRDARQQLVEKTVSSKQMFKGDLLHIYLDDAELPDGSTSSREWIDHPGACAIVPVFPDGTIMLIKQFRYAVQQIFYEVPAGKIDPGEPPLTTASRETEEETGIHAESWEYVGHFYPVIGYSNEIIHVFTAWNLTMLSEKSEEDEFIINARIPFSEALNMIHTGEINDGKTICALFQTKLWWEKNQPFPFIF